MRKFITTAITTTILIRIVGGTAPYGVLGQADFATPTMSVHQFSVHVSHEGRPLRHGPAILFML
jgi:hypothetical protein